MFHILGAQAAKDLSPNVLQSETGTFQEEVHLKRNEDNEWICEDSTEWTSKPDIIHLVTYKSKKFDSGPEANVVLSEPA